MTNQSIPALSFVTMGISLSAGFIIPALAYFIFRKKFGSKGHRLPFFIGCATFAVFAMILEGACNALILGGGRAESLMQKPVLYGFFAGFMAGLFEETGRFVAFKTILKKRLSGDLEDDSTALFYGAGHGGFEAFYVLASGMALNIVLGIMQNTGNIDSAIKSMNGISLEQVQGILTALETSNPLYFLLGIVERLSAVTIHISASVIVWFAAKDKKYLYLYPLAIVLHAAFDAFTASLSLLSANVFLIEAVLLVWAIIFALAAHSFWKKVSGHKSKLEEQGAVL